MAGGPMKFIAAVFFFLFCPAWCLADGATTQPALDLLGQVQSKLSTVQTVDADFVETRLLSMLNHKLTIRGHMALQKPDRLIWIVSSPVKYAIRIEGDEVRQWDEDTNRVDVIHLGGDPTFKAVSEQMQAWFLGNYKALGDNYDVHINSNDPISLGFTPKADSMVAKFLQRIDLTFEPGDLYIQSMTIAETGGDSTTIQFVHTKVNQPIADETWEMPPHER